MNAVLFGLGLACGVALAAAGAAIAYGKRNILLGGVVFLVGIAVVLGMFVLNARNNNDGPGKTEAPVLITTPEPTQAPEETDTHAGDVTPTPENTPLENPTDVPANAPTATPTEIPTEAPTERPTSTPTPEPGQYLKVGYDPSTIVKPENWNGSVIYLSFDDGPSYVTNKVLDNLAKYNIKAAFFVVGNDFRQHPMPIHPLQDPGKGVGLHGIGDGGIGPFCGQGSGKSLHVLPQQGLTKDEIRSFFDLRHALLFLSSSKYCSAVSVSTATSSWHSTL